MLTGQIIPSWSSVSQTQDSIIEQQPNLNCLFLLYFHTSSTHSESEPVFFSKKGFLYKSTVRDQIYLYSQTTAVINVDILMRRLTKTKGKSYYLPKIDC